ncbi:BadF/BadG/BcrA/BcrD ATPase family protein [Labrys monachus]|uniref:Glucosamine kinase n=1 Tax=Labrys monachus TaxID=217067 RepID=A0ABU0FBK1_9HYPH|nr:BadF/BadG/BcrA/BcrD ATPase family protein [Labrys monachus]MDQ0391989.1 glucosamine kinase [Labrys monachus]
MTDIDHPPLYFCVDAGATRSRGQLYDGSGTVIASAEAGPANASYDSEEAADSLLDLWRDLNAAAGRDPQDLSGVTFAIGGAGLYVQGPREAFLARGPAFAAVFVMSDGYAALIGAGGGRPCALVTIGTGVAGHRLFADGSSIQRDAWGWIVGDRGSGSWMGVRAIRHALAVRDRIAAPSLLAEAVMAQIGGVTGLLEGALSGLTAHRVAAFAPLVLDLAEKGCPVAAAILARAVGHLTDLVGSLDCADVPLYLNGGLAPVMQPRLVERIGRPVQDAAGDPLEGCLLVARGEAPPERMVFE